MKKGLLGWTWWPKIRRQLLFLRLAIRTGTLLNLAGFWLYRSPFKLGWRNIAGHTFHKSSMIYFKEGQGTHTRILMVLPKIASDFPDIRTVGVRLDFFDAEGRSVAQWDMGQVAATETLVLDSANLPESFKIKAPFEGTLLIRQTLPMDTGKILALHGLFTHSANFFDYYFDSGFITTTHDYSGWLPDQGFNMGALGMMQAYDDDDKETFLILHAAAAGIRKGDLTAELRNAGGQRLSAPIPPIPAFGFRRIRISTLFPEAKNFLGGQAGHLIVEGVFRELLRRTAYGIDYKDSQDFTFDHCFYSNIEFEKFVPASDRKKHPKGYFNPYLVLEDEATTTHAYVFGDKSQNFSKSIDLLVYNETGDLILKKSPAARIIPGSTVRITQRDELMKLGVSWPFVGHAELLYTTENEAQRHSCFLDTTNEYIRHNRVADVVLGAALWNGPKPLSPDQPMSGFRVICDDNYTTYLSLTNCSYTYDYPLEAEYELDLLVNGKCVETRAFRLKPNATEYQPVEFFFPEAKKALLASRGAALVRIRYQNLFCLANLFVTEHREKGWLSVEHSFDLPDRGPVYEASKPISGHTVLQP